VRPLTDGSLRGSRDFRWIVVANSLSAFGDELALIALTLRVFEIVDSPLAVSLVLLAGVLPVALLSPVSGLIVDRMETRRALLIASLAQAGLAAAIATTESVPLIVILAFLIGCGASVADPATFALVPVIVGEDRTTRANGTMASGRYLGSLLGPIAAGVLAQTVGTSWALVIDACTFLAIAGTAWFLQARRWPSGAHEDEPERGIAKFTTGFRTIGRDTLLKLAVLVVAATIVFGAMDNVAEVFFARDVLNAGSIGYGVLATAWLVGMVAGASLIGGRLPPGKLTPSLLVSAIVGGTAVGAAAIALSYPFAIMMFCVAGAANGLGNVAVRSLIHLRAPDHVRGRAFSAYSGLAYAMQLTATAAGGGIVVLAGARAALIVGGVGTLLVGLAATVWWSTLPAHVRMQAAPGGAGS
jgi:MFS family permease